MAKFALNSNSVFSLGGNALTCLLSADLSETVDTFMSMCAGQTYKQTITGLKEASVTVNFEVNADDDTLLGNYAVGEAGAVVFQPNGTTVGDLDITSTNGTVVDLSISTSSSGLTTGTVTINLDDLTIGAN